MIVEDCVEDITKNRETVLDTKEMKQLCQRYKIGFDCRDCSNEDYLCLVNKDDDNPSVKICTKCNVPVKMSDEELKWFNKVRVFLFGMAIMAYCIES